MFWVGGGFSINCLIYIEFGVDIGRGLCVNCGGNYLFIFVFVYDVLVGWNSQFFGFLEISFGLGWE